ncbi:hypothetical protein [Desulfovibrio sp.]|uniref:hypothetical protein n=1 Tax=Desulfovibrio sp. TaxID=885 RepID=UPI0023CDC8E0|nr:hypothetical protein [Desulfovibrio sp.]MDE7241087.1 hypothetical protein [Desulfovibrio sp.]
MPLVYATALPSLPLAVEEPSLRHLCVAWERAAAPRLSPGQRAHCRRFAPTGDALRARASRLLARLLALRALPEGAVLDLDAQGRPLVAGAPGWGAAFTHSGKAAFCLVCAPGETPAASPAQMALDAETGKTPPPADRAFAAPAPTQDLRLRRWVLAEALYKALGAPPARWTAIAAAAHAGAAQRRGIWRTDGARLCWRFLAAPGHLLCAAFPGEAVWPLRLRWRPWQELG